MLVKLAQFENAHEPIFITDGGIVVFLHPAIKVLLYVSIIALQFSRESYTLFPSSTMMLVNPEQATKAQSLISVTDFGIVMLFKPAQPSKAPISIVFTELGMVVLLQPAIRVLSAVLIMALQLFRESYTSLVSSTMILDKSVHPRNAPPSIDVIELGIVIFVRPVQPSKALPPNAVTDEGIIVFLHPFKSALSAVLMIALQLSRESNTLFSGSTVILVMPSHP